MVKHDTGLHGAGGGGAAAGAAGGAVSTATPPTARPGDSNDTAKFFQPGEIQRSFTLRVNITLAPVVRMPTLRRHDDVSCGLATQLTRMHRTPWG